MNHKERRRVERNLGILKHKNSLTRVERFERMRQNILEGKQKEKKMREIRRLQEEGQKDEKSNNDLATLATELMVKEDLSYIDALEKAKEILAEKE